MTSQRQFMKDCKHRIVLDSDIFFNILGYRRVYVLQKNHCNTHSDQWVRSQ